MRQCYRCRMFWPLEETRDGNGDPVTFWISGERRCRACVYELHNERQRAAA